MAASQNTLPRGKTCHWADGHHIAMREFTCPVGGEKFTAPGMGLSYSRWGNRLDLRPYGSMQFPFPLAVCPSNGMVIYKSEYSEEELRKIQEILNSPEYERVRTQETPYRMLAYPYEKLDEPPSNVADILLRATWEAELCEDAAAYERYALETISAYRRVEQSVERGSEEWWWARLLTANLHRRLGQFDASKAVVQDLRSGEQLKSETYTEYLDLLDAALQNQNAKPVSLKSLHSVDEP